MGKTRKDRRDMDYDEYYTEKKNKRDESSVKNRRKNKQNWKQFRNVTSDDIPDNCLGSDD